MPQLVVAADRFLHGPGMYFKFGSNRLKQPPPLRSGNEHSRYAVTGLFGQIFGLFYSPEITDCQITDTVGACIRTSVARRTVGIS